MMYNAATGQYEFMQASPMNLSGRRVTIQTDEGGAYTVYIE